jgi:hypothetical protein
MFLGTFKIYNLGLTYLIHTANTNSIIVKKTYIYKNNYFIKTNDLIFKK